LRFEIQPTPRHKTEQNDSQEYLSQELSLQELFFFLFCGSSNYFVFWLRKLLSATKTTKNPKTSKKTKKLKKQKKPKDSEECLGQGLCSEALFFLFFFVFGSGSFYRLLRLPKTQNLEKNPKNKKHQKHQRILRNVWAKDFVQRHWFFCFFCFFLVFLEFFWFLAPEAFIGY